MPCCRGRPRRSSETAAALYPLSCNGERLRRSLLAAPLLLPRSVRTPGCGSVAVSDRARTAPGSLPEIAAPTLPDHRFETYGWMLSMMIALAGELRKSASIENRGPRQSSSPERQAMREQLSVGFRGGFSPICQVSRQWLMHSRAYRPIERTGRSPHTIKSL